MKPLKKYVYVGDVCQSKTLKSIFHKFEPMAEQLLGMKARKAPQSRSRLDAASLFT
jgi:hypothetical protein